MPRYRVLHDFAGDAHQEQLSLVRGDVVVVDSLNLQQGGTGWVAGRLERSGQVGWFPLSYVEVIPEPPHNAQVATTTAQPTATVEVSPFASQKGTLPYGYPSSSSSSTPSPQLPWAVATPVANDNSAEEDLFATPMGGQSTNSDHVLTGTRTPYGQESSSSSHYPGVTAVAVPPPPGKDPYHNNSGSYPTKQSSSSFPRLRNASKYMSDSMGWAATKTKQGARNVGKGVSSTYDNLTKPTPPPPPPRVATETRETKTTLFGLTVGSTKTTVTKPAPPPPPPERTLTERTGGFMASVGATSGTFALLRGDLRGAARGAAVGGIGAAVEHDAKQKRYQQWNSG